MQNLTTKEIEELCYEVRQNLRDPLEFDTIQEIMDLVKAIKQNYEFKLSLSKDTLESLQEETATLTELNKQMEVEKKPEAIEEQKELILSEKKALGETLLKLQKEAATKDLSLADYRNKITDLNAKLSQLIEKYETNTLRTSLELFMKISNIKWDYDAEKNIKGTIYLPDDMKEFDIEDNEEGTDKLWDLIEKGCF